MKNTAFCLITTLTLCLSSLSYSQNICSPRIPTQPLHEEVPISSGFEHFSQLICSSYWIGRYWGDYGFVQNAWDGGFGYEDPCNSQRPLARMFSAMRYIDKASDWNAYFYKGFWGTDTWHEEASGAIDKVYAECGDGSSPRAAVMYPNSNAVFYYRAWYRARTNTIGELASLIIHEARHEWNWHTGETCSSCDESWDDSPVIRDEIQFLAQMYKFQPLIGASSIVTTNPNDDQAYYLSFPQLEQMRDKANWNIEERFDTKPNFTIKMRCGGWDLDYPCQAPPPTCDNSNGGGWNVKCLPD